MKKMFATVLASLFLAAIAGVFVSAQAEKPKSCATRDVVIKNEVETAVSLLQALYAKHQKGALTLETAKELGADLLRELRYGTEGYFWADTTDGLNVVLYGRKDTEGRNRLEDKDANGVYYIKAFLETAKSGGGYVEYLFARIGQSVPQAKRSYVQLFEPFGWVIGTGYYLD